MKTAVEETWEDNIGHIGRKIVDGVPLGGTAMLSSIDLSTFPAEDLPTNNCPVHHI